MLLLIYLTLFMLLLFLCIAIFPKWVLISVPVLVVLSALAKRSLDNR